MSHQEKILYAHKKQAYFDDRAYEAAQIGNLKKSIRCRKLSTRWLIRYCRLREIG